MQKGITDFNFRQSWLSTKLHLREKVNPKEIKSEIIRTQIS